MNSSINVIKFIFIWLIVFLHVNVVFGGEKFLGMYILSDWFFVFAGFTLASTILKIGDNKDNFVEGAVIFKNRVMRILPYYYLSCTIALVYKLVTRVIIIEDVYDIHRILYEYLFLEMTPLNPIRLIDTGWFLSALFMGMLIMIPIAVKFRKWFFKFSFIIFIVLFLYLYDFDGNVYSPGEWTPLTYKGLIKSIACLSLGFSGFELNKLLKGFSKYRIVLSLIVLIGYSLIIYFIYNYDDGIMYFFYPVLFMILICVQMLIKKFPIIPDNIVTRFLGNISMVLYMNHSYIMTIVEKTLKSQSFEAKARISIVYSIKCTLIVYAVVNLVSYIKKTAKRNADNEVFKDTSIHYDNYFFRDK